MTEGLLNVTGASPVLVTVTSVYPERGEALINAGALAFSKDEGPTQVDPHCGFGSIRDGSGMFLDGLRLRSLSQEHGIVSRPRPVGERLRILPNHSCLTVACFDELVVVRADQVVDRWKIWRQR